MMVKIMLMKVCGCCSDNSKGHPVPHVWYEFGFRPWSHWPCNVLRTHGWWPANWTLRWYVGWLVYQGPFSSLFLVSSGLFMLLLSINKQYVVCDWMFRWSVTIWGWEWRQVCLISITARQVTHLWTWGRNTKASSGRKRSSLSSRPLFSPRTAPLCKPATSNCPNRWRTSSAR